MIRHVADTMIGTEAYRINLIKHLSDPEKEFPRRKDYPDILGIVRKTLYRNFTPEELTKIEIESVDLRKSRCSRQRSNILNGLYKRAIGYACPDLHICVIKDKVVKTDIVKYYPPDKAAAQEFLDRTEGKVVEKKDITLTGVRIKVEHTPENLSE